MTNNSILKPDMKVAYLRNRAKDIKQGAAQFSQLLTQLKKEEQAQYIIIEADNLEMGYMAVMYHAACMNSLRAEDEDNRGCKRVEGITFPNSGYRSDGCPQKSMPANGRLFL